MAKKTRTEEKFNYGESIRRLRQTGPQRLYLIWGPEDYLAEQYLPSCAGFASARKRMISATAS